MKPLMIVFVFVCLFACNTPIRIVETYGVDSTGRMKKTVVKYYDTTKYIPTTQYPNQLIYDPFWYRDPFWRPWYYNNRIILVTPPRKK